MGARKKKRRSPVLPPPIRQQVLDRLEEEKRYLYASVEEVQGKSSYEQDRWLEFKLPEAFDNVAGDLLEEAWPYEVYEEALTLVLKEFFIPFLTRMHDKEPALTERTLARMDMRCSRWLGEARTMAREQSKGSGQTHGPSGPEQTFAERLKRLSREAGLSASDLSAAADVDPKLVKLHLSAKVKNPHPGTVKKYAEGLSKHLERLITAVDLMPPEDD